MTDGVLVMLTRVLDGVDVDVADAVRLALDEADGVSVVVNAYASRTKPSGAIFVVKYRGAKLLYPGK